MTPSSIREWPESLTRVPYWVYQDADNYREEQRRIFEGPVWSYACLEQDLARPGDFRTAQIGELPVIVVRADDGEIYAFENRCAPRGALLAPDDGGRGGARLQRREGLPVRLPRLALQPAGRSPLGRLRAGLERPRRDAQELPQGGARAAK